MALIRAAGRGGKGPRRLVVIEANTMLRIVCVSDTHGKHRKTVIPDGHVLLHASDLTEHGNSASTARQVYSDFPEDRVARRIAEETG